MIMFARNRTTMRSRLGLAGLSLAAFLSSCATVPPQAPSAAASEDIQILAINDLHGNIEVPAGATTYYASGQPVKAQLGGVARLGATLAKLRQGHPETITVAA